MSDGGLLADYARALAILSETPPQEHANALRALSLDAASFAALSAEGDRALKKAIDESDMEGLTSFKTSFDAAKAKINVDRLVPDAPPPPPARKLSESGVVPRPVVLEEEDAPPTWPFASPFKREKSALEAPPPPARPARAIELGVPGMGRVLSQLPRVPAEARGDVPRARGLPAREPRLTLMQFAALRAECLHVSPAAATAVQARYGLSPADAASESVAWHYKFAADRAIYAEYERQFAYFRGIRKQG